MKSDKITLYIDADSDPQYYVIRYADTGERFTMISKRANDLKKVEEVVEHWNS